MSNKYYLEINKFLEQYENHKSYKEKTVGWICDRIAWCWIWRKINEEEKDELTDRIIKVMEVV